MNKRQRKKKQKKYLPIIADEFNLTTMTREEQEQAIADYEQFREKYAYRKKYKDLKNGKPLYYAFPVGTQFYKFSKELSKKILTTRRSYTVNQNPSDVDLKADVKVID